MAGPSSQTTRPDRGPVPRAGCGRRPHAEVAPVQHFGWSGATRVLRARRDSNPKPSDPESDHLQAPATSTAGAEADHNGRSRPILVLLRLHVCPECVRSGARHSRAESRLRQTDLRRSRALARLGLARRRSAGHRDDSLARRASRRERGAAGCGADGRTAQGEGLPQVAQGNRVGCSRPGQITAGSTRRSRRAKLQLSGRRARRRPASRIRASERPFVTSQWMGRVVTSESD